MQSHPPAPFTTALCLLLATGCSSSGSDKSSTEASFVTYLTPGKVGASNVASVALEGDGDLWILQVPEDGQEDLNGDGDMLDFVAHVYDAASDELTNMKLVTSSFGVRDHRVLMTVSELILQEDLNGDGDPFDRILHVFDADTRALRMYPQTSYSGIGDDFAVRGDDLFYVVIEEPGFDLNGDGLSNGSILHHLDLAGGDVQPLNFGLAVGVHTGSMGDSFGINVIETSATGDLNGDDDESDGVFHVYDEVRGSMISSGLAAGVNSVQAGGVWILPVSEADQGEEDLNGNGMVGDGVFFSFDPATGVTRNLGVSNSTFPMYSSVRDDVAVLVAGEFSMIQDLNGDGDQDDWVPIVFHPLTGEIDSTEVALGFLRWTFLDGWFAFQASESAQGKDLNADGDKDDVIVMVHDLATGATRSLGLEASFQPGRFSQLLLFRNEYYASTDWNGDGDEQDLVLFIWDGHTQTITNTGYTTTGMLDSRADRYLFGVHEFYQGMDLNEDGDTNDAIVVDLPAPQHVHIFPGRVEAIPFTTVRYHSALLLLALVQEVGVDLNGDGDAWDQVLQVFPNTGPQ